LWFTKAHRLFRLGGIIVELTKTANHHEQGEVTSAASVE
jgi:hypothetical protein